MIDCRIRAGLRCALVVAGTVVCAHAWAQVPDDARELRWAEEVAPQVVVGEVVWLATPQRARVLALYADVAVRTRRASSSCTDWACIRIGG